MKRLLAILLCLPLWAGCSSKPVRHLASDAALIQPQVTTAAEVRQYLGEPQTAREISPGVLEYLYTEDVATFWDKVPVANRAKPGGGHETLTVTLKDDIVQSVVFRKFRENDPDWSKRDDGD